MAGTRWVRLDVDYFGNRKTLRAGLQGRALHIASICWVARHMTDGEIPEEAVAQILGDAGVSRRAVSLVVEPGLWVPNGSGFELHDYVTMNPSRAEVERDREGWRDRQRRFRSRRESSEE